MSEEDARAVFEDAVAAATEADHDLAFALGTLTDVIARGVERMTSHERRSVAADLVTAAADIGLRLDNTDVMPWDAVTEALVRLDPGVALAALARWDDEDLVHRRMNLAAALTTGIATGAITAGRAAALTALMEHTEPELIASIAEADRRSAPERLRAIAEELARDECLHHGRGERVDVLERLQGLAGPASGGGWIGALDDLTRLHVASGAEADVLPPRTVERDTTPERPDPLATFDWRSKRWTTPETIDAALEELLDKRQETGAFFSPGDVLDRMAAVVAPGEFSVHLDAIVASKSDHVAGWELGRVLKRRLAAWGSRPAVARWRRERLLDVVAKGLPAFCRGLAQGYAPLPDLLAATEASDDLIRGAIVTGIEQNVESLDAPTLYEFVGVIADHAPPETAAAIAHGFVARLAAAVPEEHRRPLPVDDIPTDPAEAIARFLYVLMSDVEVPLRWRAAHAVRRLARLGATAVIDALVGLLDRREERAFRDPDAPFYWLSARLWLLIALDRVADEAPHALAPHARRLLAVATDEELPHVLMRAFAASAVGKLVKSGAIALTAEEAAALASVNAPALPAQPAPDGFHRGFGHVSWEAVKDRRYSFDTMDTVPYWYGPASRIFADVTSETFLDIAEVFIVDQWSDGSVERAWDRQPRRNRLNGRDLSTMHRHGSLPSMERWDTSLEWHAMFCTVGALLRTHAPAQADEFDDYDTISAWLQRKGLTAPPDWVSDRLAPKPAEPALWRAPVDPEAWFADIAEEEVRALVRLDADGSIVAAGSWSVRSRRVDWTADVMSALVSPDTAPALLRALASAPNRFDYRVPAEDDELAIDTPPYRFVGWLGYREGDLALDEHDPLRNGIHGGAYAPGRAAHRALGLTRTIEVGRPTWRRPDGSEAFVSEAWGDLAGDQDERRMSFGDRVRSDGHRLRVTRPALRAVIDADGLDLLLQVTLTKRRNGDDGKPRYDDDARRERTRLYLLRREGSLHAAEGRLGAWAPFGP